MSFLDDLAKQKEKQGAPKAPVFQGGFQFKIPAPTAGAADGAPKFDGGFKFAPPKAPAPVKEEQEPAPSPAPEVKAETKEEPKAEAPVEPKKAEKAEKATEKPEEPKAEEKPEKKEEKPAPKKKATKAKAKKAEAKEEEAEEQEPDPLAKAKSISVDISKMPEFKTRTPYADACEMVDMANMVSNKKDEEDMKQWAAFEARIKDGIQNHARLHADLNPQSFAILVDELDNLATCIELERQEYEKRLRHLTDPKTGVIPMVRNKVIAEMGGKPSTQARDYAVQQKLFAVSSGKGTINVLRLKAITEDRLAALASFSSILESKRKLLPVLMGSMKLDAAAAGLGSAA